jgi:hypothetical protein
MLASFSGSLERDNISLISLIVVKILLLLIFFLGEIVRKRCYIDYKTKKEIRKVGSREKTPVISVVLA